MEHSLKTYLGIDVGKARIGIARGTNLARLAQPIKTVPADELIQVLRKLIDEYDAEAIVVGLPRNLSGEETAQTKSVRDWVRIAKDQIKLPFYFQDEALTTVKAEHLTGKDTEVDALAAAILLQDFLDTPEAQRVRC